MDIRCELMRLLEDAPDAVRVAVLHLMVSLKTSLDVLVKRPDFQDVAKPVRNWAELLTGLTELRLDLDRIKSSRLARLRHCHPHFIQLEHRFELLKRAYESSTLMIEIIYALIAAGQEFTTAEEVLEQSGEILLRELGADLYVCRLRDDEGSWINVAANDSEDKQTPIFVWAMEDSLPNHPVMQAVHERGIFHVLSNDLRGLERGGESVDCMAYHEGYRSRLAFLLRTDCEAFGAINLYSHQPGFFDRFDSQFLADASKIVSLTVGRQLEVGKDALAKAAGGMAHVGNNVLGIMMNYNSLVMEELEYLSGEVKSALGRTLPDRDVEGLAREIASLRKLLIELDLDRKVNSLQGVAEAILRLKAAIENLLSQVNKPVLMPYVRGQEVLDLEPSHSLPAGHPT
ncbi:MAG: histidine kinase [Desulfovibrio sp.]|nr:histidine kinase [Desulfovibrio sp.]MBI4960092.1 histidine kinase [Desulfovibrio sp.]